MALTREEINFIIVEAQRFLSGITDLDIFCHLKIHERINPEFEPPFEIEINIWERNKSVTDTDDGVPSWH